MNYLERLLRRALLEVPATPGGALHDPFADEAPWPLDEPAARVAQPQAAAIAAALQPGDSPLPVAADAAQAIWPEPVAMDVPAERPLEAQALQAAAAPAVVLPVPPAVTPPADAVSISPAPVTASDEPLSALAQADAFMRALGSPLLAPSLVPEASQPEPAAVLPPSLESPLADLPQPAVLASSPAAPASKAQLQPPEAPAPLAAPAVPADPAVAAVAAQAAAAAASPASAPAPGRFAPSPQVITVLTAAAPAASSTVTSTYRFGIGQL